MAPPADLSHIYGLGGSPCCGKSTIADRIAAKHNLAVYRCDDPFYEHGKRIRAATHPTFHTILEYNTDSLWLRPVGQQISEEIQMYREEFAMILDDLRDVSEGRPVLAEGAALMPELIAPLGIDHRRMLWMIPTPGFQRFHYAQRQWPQDVLRGCSQPDEGWDNWMSRDAGFAVEIMLQAESLSLY